MKSGHLQCILNSYCWRRGDGMLSAGANSTFQDFYSRISQQMAIFKTDVSSSGQLNERHVVRHPSGSGINEFIKRPLRWGDISSFRRVIPALWGFIAPFQATSILARLPYIRPVIKWLEWRRRQCFMLLVFHCLSHCDINTFHIILHIE